ncbi:MAG TPA: glycoside hydrolase family 76 protein [Solirubrobacteraceae bacterium]|nr:glycoside hydrolase family 76 protein [Solirubrobacteraceae bacterium]
MRATILRPCTLTLAILLAVCAGGAAPAGAQTPAPALTSAQRHYLTLAQAGVAAAERWRDPRLGWYDARLEDHDRYPLATIWDIVPLFQSLDAIAIAQPTGANRRAVSRFAAGAERYLNRGLRPIPGYSPYPSDRAANTETWFDDNGWWGLAFVQAYRATGTRRYLTDALRALRYIAAAGWNPGVGGIWWNTHHPYTAGEALASATLLATLLYQQTHSRFALTQALRLQAWANTSGFSQTDQLYAASDLSPTPIDYIQAPLIYAQALLCRIDAAPADCTLADYLTATALHRFGESLDFAPQYDAIYLQWMLALYSLDGDPALYALAAANARAAQARAVNGAGLYLRSWAGEPLPAAYAQPGMLQTHAATTSLFAWLAVARPPA